jgi:ATP-dependent Lon protease
MPLTAIMSSDTKKSKESTTTSTTDARVNVTHIFDAANDNFSKLVNESARVQPQYAQAVSNLQQEYIDSVRNAIQTSNSVQKQLVNSNFNNISIPEATAPYVQGLVKQSTDFTDNLIRITDINNQLAINALGVLRENVKNYSRTLEAAAEYNSNLAKAWASSYSSFQQQLGTTR